MKKVLIIHPEGNINNNPNLSGIVRILCESGYRVDICSRKVKTIDQDFHCEGARLFLVDKKVSATDGFVILAGLSPDYKQRHHFIHETIGDYDLIVGVDRGIIEASEIAQVKRTPLGLISYEIYFVAEAGNDFKQPEIEACRNIDFAVCQDELRAGCLSVENKIPLEKIINIPLGGRFVRKGSKSSYLYDSLGIEKNKKIALFAGSLGRWSMTDYLIETAKTWSNDWVLVLHNRYKLDEDTLIYYQERKGLSDNVHFSLEPVTDVSEVGRILHSANIGVALYQAQSNSIQEGNNLRYIGMASGKVVTYLQHGLPVVVNEIGEMSDYVRKNNLGLVVDKNSPFKIDVKSGELIQWSENCYRFFEEKLDLNKTILPLLEKIQSLIGKDSTTTVFTFDSNKDRPQRQLLLNHTAGVESGSADKVDISLILCTKDRAPLLDEMLASLNNAVKGVSCEVIVVEGGSSDNTQEVLHKHGITKVYSEAECLGPDRHSWPQLYNFGFSKARGKWAMYASDDILFSKECIAKAVKSLNSQKEEVAGGIFFYKNIHSEPDWDTFGVDFTYGSKLLMNYGLVRLDYFRQVGGLDQAYRFYCADGDLCFKLYKSGRQFIPLPGCFIVHNNILDMQKKTGLDNSRSDIELYTQRWKHFVSTEIAIPRRLLWQEDFVEAFSLPLDLEKIDRGIEYFWHGLACFQRGLFEQAKLRFLQAVKSSSCDHWRVLWYVAKAAYECGDKPLAEKAAGAVTELAPNFIEAKDLLQQIGCKPERQTKPRIGRISGNQVKTIDNNGDVLRQIKKFGLWNEGKPLRLHLGCGQNHFDGYINIDYPPSEHNLIRVKADIYADIKSLYFPPESVDEIRLHHVFEHFNRVTALAMLIKWHKWLKIGGRIHIETPDLIGSAKTLVSNASWKTKMGVARHLAGDQAANWGYHVDHWFGERFERTLGALGFESVQTWSTSWTKEPYLANVKVTAVKSRGNSLQQQLKAAEKLLWESTVCLEERSKWEVWKKQLHAVLAGDFVASPSNTQTPDVSSVSAAPTILSQNSSQLPLDEIHGFNQRSRDRWVQAKARTVPSGSRVLDVGAGTCPYHSFFKHCDYKAHDFKKYKGIKKGNTTEYGQIDYVSDICNIPVPDNSFDVILCTEVLEHVAEPIEALREMLRIVRPGGRILITAPLGSGLHQLPYHFYGGFSPEWYRYFFDKFGCRVVEVTPNGGFFKLLAQECARVQWTLPQHQHLHGSNVEFIRHLFGEWLPRYLFSLEEACFIDQFTVGYHVEAIKVANAKLLISDSEICQWDKRRMESQLNKNTISPICSKDSTMQAQNSHWPVITMSVLGKFGRFGNQLFQYASLRIYARKYNLRTETPKWIGQRLFGCYDPPIQKKLPLVEVPNKLVPFWEDPTFYAKQPLTSVDLKGYFQYHTKYYVKYKEHLRSLFSPLPEIEAKMRIGLESLCSKGKTLVGLHLRRGDFGHHHHFIAPIQWYKEWLKGFWETLEDPVLFIASDEPEKVVGDFVEYKPVTSAELGMELAEAPFYPDFYILTQCDAVAISNSTFSFVACMLNKRGKIFARPTLSNRKLIPFDPWNSESNFKDEKVAANESYHEQTGACTETGSTASSGDSNSFCRNSGTLVSGNEKNRDITVKPKISVLMSVYNGERFVTEALKSIYNQTYQDFEVVIVDDGSTDRTSEILLNLKDSRTFIYRNPENLGLTKSLNIGLKLCRGEYVARMDADDISHPQRFERQVKFLDENPDCLVLGCWYGRIDSDGKIWGSKEPPTEYEDTKKQLLIEACVGHGTAIVRRAALVEVGGYNEQYTYAQDYDLWLRLSEVGLIRNLDEYLYLFRSWPGNISAIKLKEQTEFAELAISQALQRRYGNGPIDREVSYGLVKRAITWFNLREYVNCINTLNNTQKMAPNITKRFKGYDLLLALAYFAIGREQQCLTCLRREIQNHNNPAAGKFLSDYFEKNLRMDVQNWCSQNSGHYNLQLVDMENEGVQQSSCCKRYEPLVSVIMPAYNAQKFITEAIQSVLSQTYRNFELVVVDDGSTDGTKDIVFSFKDERIKYFYHENSGLAATHNTGIKNSKGLFLVKLDSDDMMTADFIAAHLAEFEKHPDVDLVYCDDCLIEENSKPIRVIKRPEYTDRKMLIRDLFRCGFPVVPFRTCIRRSVFDKIGFFDENLRMAEDYDMMRRFVKMGLKIQHLPGALYLRRMTPDSLSRNFTSQNAKFHFDVVRRFTNTFTCDELFPDVAWDQIDPQIRQLHAKCLTAGTYLAIGQEYVKTNATEYSRTAFDRACSELNDCLKMDPENQGLRQLLQKSKLIRARYTEAPQQVVSK